MSDQDRLRRLPKVDLLARAAVEAGFAPTVAVAAARDVIAAARRDLLAGRELGAGLEERVVAHAARLDRGRLREVVNATGIVLHTNLGRAPWSASAKEAALRASGACDLELSLDSGERGGRLSGLQDQLRHLVGAEAALVVNNNAAAVLLVLTALAAGREVVVSRGELVEIGGSFRVPEVIASGGARLVEVGTTNRTRLADVEAACTDRTALLLKVHPANFRITGFTEQPARAELAALGRRRGLPVVEDLGSGRLRATDPSTVEPSVAEVLADGVDLVTFSGDKLLGGPQAGLIVGRPELVARLRAHPLYRALRVDKVTLAALEATLGDHLAGRAVPAVVDSSASRETLRLRADRLRGVAGAGELVDTDGYVGGGAAPGEVLPSVALRLAVGDAERFAHALRTGTPAVLPRVHRDAVLLDVRAVRDDQVVGLGERLATLLRTE